MKNENKEHQPSPGENRPNEGEVAQRAYELYQREAENPATSSKTGYTLNKR
jgi:hypothetical protein